MKALLILLLLTSCASTLGPGCDLYVNKIETGISTITEIGTTCLQPDGTFVTKIDHTFEEMHRPQVPHIPLPKK